MSSPWILATTYYGPMIINRFDRMVAANGITYGVGAQLLDSGVYDVADLETTLRIFDLLRHYRSPNNERHLVFLDGGANIGAFTIPWAKHVKDWGQIVAIEPQDQIFYALCGNVVLNNLDNVKCINSLLHVAYNHSVKIPRLDYTKSASFGSLSMQRRFDNDTGQDISWEETHSSTSVPLEICGEHLDFVKLDLEGMEIQVLSSAAAYIEKTKPVLCVEHLKTSVEGLQSLFAAWDYIPFVTDKDIWAVHQDDPVLAHLETRTNQENVK